MPILNLSLPEFLAILGTITAFVTALYLFDRRRRRQTVPSLRFFRRLEQAPAPRHRRRIDQPWSLLLQLAAMCLLLLAIAQLQFGGGRRAVHDHVLILDTSAWMNAKTGETTRLMDTTRAAAGRWLGSVPSADRVLLVRADAIPTPATAFETDRNRLRRAIADTEAGASPLNFDHAIRFAEQARAASEHRPGEIVFIGAARTSEDELPQRALPRNVRFIHVEGPDEHCGLRHIGVHRSAADQSVWNILVTTKNYGRRPRMAELVLSFSGIPLVSRHLVLAPGAEQRSGFTARTRTAGSLEAKLVAGSAFTADSHATLQLPAAGQVSIAVYSDRPDLLRPLFTGIPGVSATFQPTSAWRPGSPAAIVVFDRFAPAQWPAADSIWINPPVNGSPVRVRSTAENARLLRWGSDRILSAGLQARNVELGRAQVLRSRDDDIRVAETDAGPVVVARPGKPRTAVIGFDLLNSHLRFELATPLLFANLVRWMAPDVFREVELTAGSVGAVSVELDAEVPADAVSVSAEGASIPWTMDGRTVRFFTENPGIVRVNAGNREYIYSLTLATPGDVVWSPTGVKMGIPPRRPIPEAPRDLWQWLALAGGLLLLADWLLYGRRVEPAFSAARQSAPRWRKAS